METSVVFFYVRSRL